MKLIEVVLLRTKDEHVTHRRSLLFFFMHELYKEDASDLKYRESHNMIADMLTKPLNKNKFKECVLK